MDERWAYKYGFNEGYSAFENNRSDPELKKSYREDDLGSYAMEILSGYSQYADTIYYYRFSDDDERDEMISVFEEGFFDGFDRAARDYWGGRNK